MVICFAGCCVGQAPDREAAGSSHAEASQVTSALTVLWPPLCHHLVPLSVLLAASLGTVRRSMGSSPGRWHSFSSSSSAPGSGGFLMAGAEHQDKPLLLHRQGQAGCKLRL